MESKKSFIIVSSFVHIGMVRQSSFLSHVTSSHSRQDTGARLPSVSLMISPTTYSSGLLVSLYPPPYP